MLSGTTLRRDKTIIQDEPRENFFDPLRDTAVCIPSQITGEKREKVRTGEARPGQASKVKKKDYKTVGRAGRRSANEPKQ